MKKVSLIITLLLFLPIIASGEISPNDIVAKSDLKGALVKYLIHLMSQLLIRMKKRKFSMWPLKMLITL